MRGLRAKQGFYTGYIQFVIFIVFLRLTFNL